MKFEYGEKENLHLHDEAYQKALGFAERKQVNARVKIGSTAAWLRSASGKEYLGKSLVAACGLGYCAEQGAIAVMLNAGETVIESLMAVDHEGTVLVPCGKCLELISQLDDANRDTRILLGGGKEYTLRQLYPIDWKTEKV
ncbi:MAG: cytidine deaminase [Clostridia bacterium]|nr:cytidine deaminase [Clostridia bacterium]